LQRWRWQSAASSLSAAPGNPGKHQTRGILLIYWRSRKRNAEFQFGRSINARAESEFDGEGFPCGNARRRIAALNE